VTGGCLSQRGEVGWPCGRRGQGEGPGGLANLGGELLEAGRDVQREESGWNIVPAVARTQSRTRSSSSTSSPGISSPSVMLASGSRAAISRAMRTPATSTSRSSSAAK
jgi:hypothetical protein